MKKIEYIICVKTEHNGWCLESLGGYNIRKVINAMQEIEKRNPNKQYKVVATNPAENWWNTIGTH